MSTQRTKAEAKSGLPYPPIGRSCTRRQFLHTGLAAGLGLSVAGCLQHHSSSANVSPARPPNFVFIFADDLGYGDLSCYGNSTINTPNLDRMASQGLRFTSFYSNAAVCTPSRAGLLTGRYPARFGLTYVLFPNAKIGFPDSEISLAQALKQRGYTTACIGKWHLGDQPQHLPTRHGFDHYFGIPYSNDMEPTPLLRNEQIIEEPAIQSTLTARYTQEAVRFIADNKDKPFFLYLPHSMPHVPLAVSDPFKNQSAGGRYGDVIEELDSSVAQILAALKSYGLDDNTLVIFTSDNGPWLAKGEDAGSAGPLRDGKFSVFEGGVRMPCIARWPGRIQPGRVDPRPAIMLDWFPTFLTLAGCPIPADRTIDGKNIAPVLFNTGRRPDEEFFFFIDNTIQAHRSGPWKLKLTPTPQNASASTRLLMLFNVDEDPAETVNLAQKYPDIVQRLQAQIAAFQKTL